MLRHQLRRTAFSRDVKAILAWTRTRESAPVHRMRFNYAGHPGRRRLLTGLHPGGDGHPRFGLIAAGSVVAVAAQQRQHLLRIHNRARAILASEHALDQRAFAAVQFADAVFDRALRHQPIDRHSALLADAVGAAGGLVLGGRVPTAVSNDHVVGHRQVQTEAAGLEADRKEVALAGLERGHLLAAPL